MKFMNSIFLKKINIVISFIYKNFFYKIQFYKIKKIKHI